MSVKEYLAACLSALTFAVAQACPAGEVTGSVGTWVPFLPDYQAISITDGFGGNVLQENLFRDDQTGAGLQLQLRKLFDLPSNGWQMDTRGTFAFDDSLDSNQTFADPGTGSTIWMAGLDGNGRLSTLDGETINFRLASEVEYSDQFVGLRHSGLGCAMGGPGTVATTFGFSHLRFEQDFTLAGQLSGGSVGQYAESLNTDYYGGQLGVEWSRLFGNTPITLETNLGLYNMRARYRGRSDLRDSLGFVVNQSSVADRIDEFAVTLDVLIRWEHLVRDVPVRPFFSARYLSEMASIDHPQTEEVFDPTAPASANSTSGWALTAGLEVLLW